MTVEKDITCEEVKAINELRKRFEKDSFEKHPEVLEDEYYIRRFLAARDFNIDNAVTMLRKHLECREKYDVKNILSYKKHEIIEKYFPYEFIGYDKEGCVIRYCHVGNADKSGIMSSLKIDEVAKNILLETERDTEELKKQSKKLGRNVDKCVYIANCANLSFAEFTDKKVIYGFVFLMQLYINNYPERLKAAYALNVSFYASLLHSFMKTIAPASVLEKIHLYSDESYKEDLLKMIDADTLPAFLGGNRTDPDGNPLCTTFINQGGGRVPEIFYLRKNKQQLSKLPGVQKVTLSRAAFHEVNMDVKEPGSYLEWEFETKCRDIGFGVFYQELIDDEEKITEIVPIQRIDTESYPETGTFRCEIAGTYVIVFDNTYSWIRTKEIYYRTKIVTPKEKEIELAES